MLHMYSILACRSRTTTFHLSRTGLVSPLMAIPSSDFLPNSLDLQQIRGNLIVLVSRLLTQSIVHLRPLSKCIPDHILHKYSQEMAQKSEVVVLDVVIKNEAKHSDMNDIMQTLKGYLPQNYPHDRIIASGGDQLTRERQLAVQRHMVDGDTPKERLQLLEQQIEDWHCLVVLLSVRLS